MVSTGTTKEESRPGERFIPSVRPPRKSFLDSLDRADQKLFDKHLHEPAEYVYSPKFKLARTERQFFGKSAGAAELKKCSQAGLTTPDSDKMGSSKPSHSAETERFLFDRYNYARYRIYNILQAHADRALPVKASRDFLLWARRAHQLRSEIIRTNMALVMSMTKRSRLVGLDSDRHRCASIRVDTPYADFSDRQLAELALDLGTPFRMAPWWNDASNEEYRRWRGVFEAIGCVAAG